MAPSRTRLRRRHIVPLVLAVAVLPLIGLASSSWQLLEQDRAFQRQQRQERLDDATSRIVEALQTAIAESERALIGGEESWPPGAITVAFREDGISVAPPARVAFLPSPEPLPAASPDARTVALLSRGRELAAAGQHDAALQLFAELRQRPAFSIEDIPSWLAARYMRVRILQRLGREADLGNETWELARDVRTLASYLSGPVYKMFADDLVEWGATPLPLEPYTLSLALDTLWRRWSTNGFANHTSRYEVFGGGTDQITVLWQRSPGSLHTLIATQAFVESVWMPRARAIARLQRVSVAVGHDGTATEGLPWAITISDQSDADAAFRKRRTIIIVSFLTLFVVVAAASYVAIRSIDRELAVARQQSDFVAAVSHEFRTPLTSLKQFVELLREQPGLEETRRRECYDAQARSVDRLSRLVETLLDFGRLDAGRHQYRFAPQDCAALAQSVVADFTEHAVNAGYRIQMIATDSATVNVDREAVSRALWNLLDNAMKYSPGQDTIEVGVRSAHGSVCIDVRDRGIGIGPQESRDIFRRFHRGAEARSRGIRGTGLGLAMVIEIMQAHGGRVDLDSQPGQGSTFTLVFPAAA